MAIFSSRWVKIKASFHRDYAQTQNTLEQVRTSRQFVKLRYFETISLFLVRLGRLEITNTSGEKKRRRASRNAWTYWDPSFDCMGPNFYVCYFHIIRWTHHQFDLKDTSKIILHHCKRILKAFKTNMAVKSANYQLKFIFLEVVKID